MPAFMKNWMTSEKNLATAGIFTLVASGAPTDGTSGTGAGVCAPGSTYVNTANGYWYTNTGTTASPVWVISPISNNLTGDVTVTAGGVTAIGANKVLSTMLATTVFAQATGTISSADLVGTGAGQFGHANGYPLVAAQGAQNIVELISAIFHYDFSVAAYTGGGNTTVNISGGGAALTGLVSNANSFQSAADKVLMFVPLAATFIVPTVNTGINLVTASAFTQPGTAAGVIRYVVNYRVHATGF